jgi:hypothetical protein
MHYLEPGSCVVLDHFYFIFQRLICLDYKGSNTRLPTGRGAATERMQLTLIFEWIFSSQAKKLLKKLG